MDRSSLVGGAGIGAVLLVALSLPHGAPAPAVPPAQLAAMAAATSTTNSGFAPHLSGVDLLSDYYAEDVSGVRNDSLQILIATVADPVSSHLDWSYDAQLESIRRAFEHSGYIVDRYWLPWRTAGDTALLNRGIANAFPAAQYPGVMLFRRADARDTRLCLLYLVGEIPTSGIHQAAFHAALVERNALLDTASASAPIRIVGPTFSGSSMSLRRGIQAWRTFIGKQSRVAITSGSASDQGNAHILDLPGVSFEATVHTSARLNAVAESLIVQRLGLNISEIAFLREATTQFGSTGALDTNKAINDGAEPLTIAFPLSISGLRAQYARHPELLAPDAKGAPQVNAGPRLALDQREPAALTESPAVMSQLTAPATEILFDQIERMILMHHVRAVGILATDIRDELFLASEVKRRLRDVQLFFIGSNALLLRRDYTNALKGSLVFSTYPLFPENQYWDLSRPGDDRLVFLSDEAEGEFNATLRQLGEDQAMTEYVTPIDTGRMRKRALPPTWVTVVGENAMYPVAEVPSDPTSADGKYMSARRESATRAITEWPRHGSQFLLALLLVVVGFIGSYVLVQRRTAPRVDPIVAAPADALEDAPTSSEERAALLRAARSASLLLHRELYVTLRYFALFSAFASALLLVLRPQSHGIPSPVWPLVLIGAIAAFLTFVAFRRAVVQSVAVLSLGIDHGLRFVFAGVWPRRRDRVLWHVEVGVRIAVLFAGLFYFLLVLDFLYQVLRLDNRASALFFQRAVSITGGVSPAYPLLLAGIAFASWCSWHLMRISLLSEPTVFEEYLLRRADREGGMMAARRTIRRLQNEAERAARSAINLSFRSVAIHKRELEQLGVGRARRSTTAQDFIVQANAAYESTLARVSEADRAIADVKNKSSGTFTVSRTLLLETSDIRRSAERARKAVASAREAINVQPDPAPARSSGAFDGLERHLDKLVQRVTKARLVPNRISQSYLEFEYWYEGSRRDRREERRSPNAARDLSDALFYLVPSGPAFVAFVAGIGFALWLASARFELSLEALVIRTNVFGLTSFDMLFRFAVLALCGASAWAVYRLGSAWNSVRAILNEIPEDLEASFQALPPKLARLTRLTPFGHASGAEIEDEVEERWIVSKDLFGKLSHEFCLQVENASGGTPFERPAPPRSRPFDIEDSGYPEFERFSRMVEFCRGEKLLQVKETDVASPESEEGKRQRWARSVSNLYAVYVADYIDWVFQHLRYMATFLAVALVLTVLLLSSYPFQPQGVIKAIYLIVLLVGVATLLYVIVTMSRDRILSAIADTKAGVVNWDSEFIGAVITYGVLPLLTVVTTEFPEVRDVLFSWVTPILRAFAKG